MYSVVAYISWYVVSSLKETILIQNFETWEKPQPQWSKTWFGLLSLDLYIVELLNWD